VGRKAISLQYQLLLFAAECTFVYRKMYLERLAFLSETFRNITLTAVRRTSHWNAESNI